MVGRAETMVSPSSSMTRRSTPCVLGCCGPMFTVIVSVRSSGMATRQRSAGSGRLRRDERRLDQIADDVEHRQVPFLDAGRGRPGDGEDEVGVRRQVGGRGAGRRQSSSGRGPGRAQAVDDVRRAAARWRCRRRRRRGGRTPRPAAEHALEAVVVADRGEHAACRWSAPAPAGPGARGRSGRTARRRNAAPRRPLRRCRTPARAGPRRAPSSRWRRRRRCDRRGRRGRAGRCTASAMARRTVVARTSASAGAPARPGARRRGRADWRVGRSHRGAHARAHAPGRAFVPGAAPPAYTRRDSMLRTNSSSVTWVGDVEGHRHLDLDRVVLARRDGLPSPRASGCAAGRGGRRRRRRTGRRPRARTSWRWARCRAASAARRRRRETRTFTRSRRGRAAHPGPREVLHADRGEVIDDLEARLLRPLVDRGHLGEEARSSARACRAARARRRRAAPAGTTTTGWSAASQLSIDTPGRARWQRVSAIIGGERDRRGTYGRTPAAGRSSAAAARCRR